MTTTTKIHSRPVSEQEFNAAVEFALNRYETKGDAQARSAEIERSFVDLDRQEVVLVNKPLSGWRFSTVRLTSVPLKSISA